MEYTEDERLAVVAREAEIDRAVIGVWLAADFDGDPDIGDNFGGLVLMGVVEPRWEPHVSLDKLLDAMDRGLAMTEAGKAQRAKAVAGRAPNVGRLRKIGAL